MRLTTTLAAAIVLAVGLAAAPTPAAAQSRGGHGGGHGGGGGGGGRTATAAPRGTAVARPPAVVHGPVYGGGGYRGVANSAPTITGRMATTVRTATTRGPTATTATRMATAGSASISASRSAIPTPTRMRTRMPIHTPTAECRPAAPRMPPPRIRVATAQSASADIRRHPDRRAAARRGSVRRREFRRHHRPEQRNVQPRRRLASHRGACHGLRSGGVRRSASCRDGRSPTAQRSGPSGRNWPGRRSTAIAIAIALVVSRAAPQMLPGHSDLSTTISPAGTTFARADPEGGENHAPYGAGVPCDRLDAAVLGSPRLPARRLRSRSSWQGCSWSCSWSSSDRDRGGPRRSSADGRLGTPCDHGWGVSQREILH